MIFPTLRTVLAIVASHTGTSIVIDFIGTSCTVFARIGITIIDILKIQIDVEKIKI